MNRPPETEPSDSARREAFCLKCLEGERLAQEGRMEAALNSWGEALKAADGDFKRAYVLGCRASLLAVGNHFEEAVVDFSEGIALAEKIPWAEWVYSFAINLGNLYSHLARFNESARFFRMALASSGAPRGHPAWVGLSQNLGSALIEAGKYREALELFLDCRGVLGEEGDPLEKAIADLHLARIYNALGMAAESSGLLEEARQLLALHHFESLQPYLKLNEGRFELIQGRFGSAFRIFEEAAGEFEAVGDLAGKIEVLLALSAPLLEHMLLKEAQELIAQLIAWEDLVKYPALQHAIRLRRLALGAFSGEWVQEDITLLLKGAGEVGRFEDWLRFWFHLSLAAGRIGNSELRDTFLGLAKAFADRVASDLTPAQRENFMLRPDIARLRRLTRAKTPTAPEAPAVRARRSLPTMDSAEAASVAPPVKGEEDSPK